MDTPQTPVTSQSPATLSDASEVRREVESIRQTVISALVLMIVVSGTLNIYLLRQWRTSRADLQAMRPQASSYIENWEKGQPYMRQFLSKLAEFDNSGRADQTFHDMMRRYGLTNVSATATSPAPVAPAPAATAPAAKKK